jgi:hypothetical protein
MPITRPTPRLRRLLGACLLLTAPLAAAPAGVAVLRAAPWSPGDDARAGAGELEVFLVAARLQREHRVAGLVGVGDRHGMFLAGAESALRLLACRGLPVAKLARGSDLAPDPERIFLDATGLAEAEAAALLARCLEKHGPPPVAANPEAPTAREVAAIRAHLRPFHEAFALAAAPRLAAR